MLATVTVSGCFSGCSGFIGKDDGEKVSLNVPDGAPAYEDNEYIELTAFMSPPKGEKRAWGAVREGHPDDPETVWDSFITEDNFQDYKDAGFTFLLSETSAGYISDFEGSPLQKYMDLAERMEIPVVVYSGQLGEMSGNEDPRLSDDVRMYIDKMLDDLSKYKLLVLPETDGFTD